MPFQILYHLHYKVSASLSNRLTQFIIADASLRGRFTLRMYNCYIFNSFFRLSFYHAETTNSELNSFLSTYGMFHSKKGYPEGTVFLPDSCSVHCLIFWTSLFFSLGVWVDRCMLTVYKSWSPVCVEIMLFVNFSNQAQNIKKKDVIHHWNP